ncbi:MAG: hypothetical protein HY315_05210 [Acidobacteria bacterium]|nr:hypothetical protein [Acidobacteriota bacterium]
MTTTPVRRRNFKPTATGLWITAFLLGVAAVATSPFWTLLLIRKPGAVPLPKAVAVLPFQGPIDPEARALLEHLRETIVVRIAESRELAAIPLEQLRPFERDQRDLRAVGSAAGADLLVTGTVTPAGNRLILQLYLVAASLPSAPSWMNRYDLPRSGVPSSREQEIADEIIHAARAALR